MKKISCKQGFTLIELLVVVLIIGILAAVAVPQYKKAVMKARLVQALSFVNSAHKAIAADVLANGYRVASYTGSDKDADLDIDITSGMDCSETCTDGHFFYYAYVEEEFYGTWVGTGIIGTEGFSVEKYADGREYLSCKIETDEGKMVCDIIQQLIPGHWGISDLR